MPEFQENRTIVFSCVFHITQKECFLLINFVPLQDMLNGMFKEDSSFGFCTDPESLVNLEEVYQPSPNSVLEPPFEKEISSSSLCCQSVDSNLHGNDISCFVFYTHFIV